MKLIVNSVSDFDIYADGMCVFVGVLCVLLIAVKIIVITCDRKKEREISVLKRGNNDLEEKIIYSSHAIESLRSELESEKGALASSVANNKALKSEVEKLRKSLEMSVDERSRRQIETLESEKKEAVEGARKQVASLVEEKSAEIASLKASHSRELKEVCEAKDAEIASAKRETEIVRSEKDAEISDLNASHKSELAHVRESKDAEISLAQSETRRVLDEKSAEIVSLKASHSRELKEVCEAKDAEIAKIRRDCDEMLSRFWPTLGGENAEVSEIFTAWVEEMRSAESISSPVISVLSRLFAWNSAFVARDESSQWKELAEFGRSLFKWCAANKMSHESAWELSEKFIGEFNRILKSVPEIAYRAYEPKLGVAFDVKKMFPCGKDSVGRVERIDAWGIQKVDGIVLKRADVILKK